MINILELQKMIKSGNVDQIYDEMLRTNPQFKDFVEKNKNKPIDVIAQEHGIDPSILRQFLN